MVYTSEGYANKEPSVLSHHISCLIAWRHNWTISIEALSLNLWYLQIYLKIERNIDFQRFGLLAGEIFQIARISLDPIINAQTHRRYQRLESSRSR